MKTIEFNDPSFKTMSQPRETSNTEVVAAGNSSAGIIVMFSKETSVNDISKNSIPLSVNNRFFKLNKFFCEGVLMDHVLLLYNCCS